MWIPELVVDFDFMRPGPEGSDPFEAMVDASRSAASGLDCAQWRALVWRPAARTFPTILKDYERFSSRRVFIGHGPAAEGGAAGIRSARTRAAAQGLDARVYAQRRVGVVRRGAALVGGN